MAITSFSTTYTAMKSSIIGAVQNLLPIVAGVPDSVLSSISNRYIVTLRTSFPSGILSPGARKLVVNAYLQEFIVLDNSSDWEGVTQGIPGADFAIKTADAFLQATINKSAITTALTRRKWSGSAPLKLSLKLKFEAINDIQSEVLQPCMILQQLTLPRGGIAGIGLVPPGPSPYKIGGASSQNWTDRGEHLSVDIGGFLVLDSVIVENVQVKYENRMSSDGPIGADVTLTMSSYEMLTKEGLAKAYKTIKPTTPTTGTLGVPAG